MTAAYLQLFSNTTQKNIDSRLWRPSEVGIPVRPTESVVFVTKYAQGMTSKSSRCLGNHLTHRKIVHCFDIKHVSHWLNNELKFYRIFRKKGLKTVNCIVIRNQRSGGVNSMKSWLFDLADRINRICITERWQELTSRLKEELLRTRFRNLLPIFWVV